MSAYSPQILDARAIDEIRSLHRKFQQSNSGGHLLSLARHIPRLLDDHDALTERLAQIQPGEQA